MLILKQITVLATQIFFLAAFGEFFKSYSSKQGT